jgi:hypothetical protein
MSDVKVRVHKQCLHSYIHGESACEGANAKRMFMQVTIYLFLMFGGDRVAVVVLTRLHGNGTRVEEKEGVK